jgi:hypothetical protein
MSHHFLYLGDDMEKLRVNRITVNIDKQNDDTVISLYKTNTLLGTINADDLEIDSFKRSGVSAKAYQLYCRDIVINLLDNGGIDGYYYDPKDEREGVKYDATSFATACMGYVENVLGDNYNWKRTYNDEVSSMEQYSDNYIKNAKGLFEIRIEGYEVSLQIVAEIKSGQMCRPRAFMHNGNEYTFNITNINRLMKSL